MRRDSTATGQAPPTKAAPTEQPEKVKAIFIKNKQCGMFDHDISGQVN